MTVVEPRLTLERRLLREHTVIIACDEVGRGALAGPVAVGAAVVGPRTSRRRVPQGLRDSKLVSEMRRAEVAARAADWVDATAVGWSTAAEIDEVGIMRALGRAALRAIEQLRGVVAFDGALVLLDGNYDYISACGGTLPVRTQIKADRDCASAAAASVVAKVARDALMVGLHTEHPAYEWSHNKGYASPAHRAAIRAVGLSPYHRASWAISDAPTLF
ncbi:ribonuclease HII [Microbacterium terrisoli]|jgi:ribonuclease HII|uniref:ribonuclease HII n=1 Tax=Microbacterium terrisoli TaxID=3242192 RepID=UPI002803FDE9|nr:ribonuclease HII [Microbacterium protaetiae]